MYLIVGLGNPGKKYAGTRHNIGFRVIDKLAMRWGIEVDKRKFESTVGSGDIKGKKVVLIKPETFMNRSGQAVRAVMDFYKLEAESLVVIYDDMALPVGKIRIREKGTAGGHNGLSNVIRHAGTNSVGRIRIGIGSSPAFMDAADYVLGRFGSSESSDIESAVEQAADAVEMILTQSFVAAMDKFNRDAAKSEGQDE